MRFPVVVFDLDGTLADSAAAVVAAMQAAFASVDLPAPDAGAVRRLVGLPLDEVVGRLAPTHAGAIALAYRAEYVRLASDAERLFPGIEGLLGELRSAGRRLAIATGKSQQGADASALRLGLRDRVHAVHGILPGTPGKPHPAVLARALSALAARPEQAVVVGDTTYDVQMAHALGVPAVAVTWGCHDRAQLAGADAIVDDPGALLALLTR